MTATPCFVLYRFTEIKGKKIAIKNKTVNPLQKPPTQQTLTLLRSLTKLDLEFFDFIKHRFHKLYNFVVTNRRQKQTNANKTKKRKRNCVKFRDPDTIKDCGKPIFYNSFLV